MGKTGRWLRNFLTGKKEKEKDKENSTAQVSSNDTEILATPPSVLPNTPKEKRRWSFRRSSATAAPSKDLNSLDQNGERTPVVQENLDSEDEQKKHAMAVAAATAAAVDAAVTAAQAAAAVIRLTAGAAERASTVEEAAATKIQSVFRAYLARKALHALKGLVKLQALVRGHLVRKQATATLRCMQALVNVQAKVRAQRLRMAEEANPSVNQKQTIHRKSKQENQFRHTYHDIDVGMEENIKIMEMDHGESEGSTKSRNSYSNHQQTEQAEHRFSTYYASNHIYPKQDNCQVSPALTDISPRASSGHFEDHSFSTAQSSPQYYSAVSKPDPSRIPFTFPQPDYIEPMSSEYPFFPNYMTNTESSRAKVRSQSAPKQRTELYERQPSRQRASMEGRNIPRAMRMQRSSSHVGAPAHNYQYPWNIKLDRSSVSLKDSECGSTSTVLTNTNYCRSLVTYEALGNRY
ncbi:hypothetical protein HS088_TW01G00231 [Tripterygium wilfordii]|uniref:DUF4005 domain-containing protein n=1 Tax=Tripterygium wilfordii TaxID=458696 RepID=A0A7J7E1A7_TRIWF|nr:protein IQ-DOMAIN 14-like [Tripterygium wilfordii]KAF5752323.1 hypothetical protein HS088_TW01G00231 [Tripterygium wilfordii]